MDYFAVISDCESILIDLADLYSKREPSRIEDLVALRLSARAFRLTISGIYIGLSGYPDSVPNIKRTVFEAWSRLLQLRMSNDPAFVAFGYLLFSKEREIQSVQSEIDFRRANGLDYANFESNLTGLEQQHDNLKQAALDAGLDPKQTAVEFRKARIGQLIKEWDYPELKRFYQVDYSTDCGFVHASDAASYTFSSIDKDRVLLDLGPSSSPDCLAFAWDVATCLCGAIAATAEAFGCADIIARSRALLEVVGHLTDQVYRIIRSPKT